MWRIPLFLSILPIAAALLLRWWFGLRVLALRGGVPAVCEASRWDNAIGPPNLLPGESAPTASQLGKDLRAAALLQWSEREPKSAKARESTRRFGLAVPPLAAMVGAMGVIAARVPPMMAIAAFAAATALAAVFGLLSLGAELRAIAITAKQLRGARAFRRADEEDATIECAIAHAWCETVPPVLRWLK